MSRGPRYLFLGHFGSGKTEVASAHAVSLVGGPLAPQLLDLDFITPYYRARDAALELQALGVDVVAPEGDLGRSDLPVVTARATQALALYEGPVVADIGGDEGARVVGSLSGRLETGYHAYMVVNPLRPGTGTPEAVAQYARWLEGVARLRFTGLINNANAGPLTEPGHVRDGLVHVQAAAALLDLPVVGSTARHDLVESLSDLAVRPLTLRMRPVWELPV